MEDLDDLINDILKSKPQAKKPEVFYLPQTQGDKNDQVITYAPITKNEGKVFCGCCKTLLKGKTWNWKHIDDLSNVWWWCCRCMSSINCTPDKEEKLRELAYKN